MMTRDTVGYAYPPDPPESDETCPSCGRRGDGILTTWPFEDGFLCIHCAESEAVDWLQSDPVAAALTAFAALDAEDVLRIKALEGLTETDDGETAVAVADALGFGIVAVSEEFAPKPKEGGL